MQVTDLRLASPALEAALVDATRQALQLWCAHWGVAPAQATVCVAEVERASTAAGTWATEAERGPAAHLFWPADLRARLAHLLYGTPEGRQASPGTLAARSVEHVEGELRRLLSQAWMVEAWREATAPAMADLPGRWHAPVGLRVAIGGAELHACVPAARLRRQPRHRTATSPLPAAEARAAFGSNAVRLTAVLGAADISVADLAALQVGDVLVLDGRANGPIQINAEGSQLALPVQLGQREGLRAVQFGIPSSRHS
jgi:hypothetical protein